MPVPKTELLKIGELKNLSGISVKTIRYYEEFGLIKVAIRTEGGFRLFNPETSARLAFIKRAQALGLSLGEIKEILEIYDRGKLPCQHVRQKLQVKIREIERQIAELEILKTQLVSLLTLDTPASELGDEIICPIIQQNYPHQG